MNWAKVFPYLTSYQLTTTSSSFSKAFCREKTSTISKRQKMLSKSSSNSEAWIFITTGISKLFFFGKNVLTVMVLILINKDMFESTYDLKFMAPNCNYICTKLFFFILLKVLSNILFEQNLAPCVPEMGQPNNKWLYTIDYRSNNINSLDI